MPSPGTAGAGAVLRAFANESEPIPSPAGSRLIRSQPAAVSSRRRLAALEDVAGDPGASGPSAAHGTRNREFAQVSAWAASLGGEEFELVLLARRNEGGAPGQAREAMGAASPQPRSTRSRVDPESPSACSSPSTPAHLPRSQAVLVAPGPSLPFAGAWSVVLVWASRSGSAASSRHKH